MAGALRTAMSGGARIVPGIRIVDFVGIPMLVLGLWIFIAMDSVFSLGAAIFLLPGLIFLLIEGSPISWGNGARARELQREGLIQKLQMLILQPPQQLLYLHPQTVFATATASPLLPPPERAASLARART